MKKLALCAALLFAFGCASKQSPEETTPEPATDTAPEAAPMSDDADAEPKTRDAADAAEEGAVDSMDGEDEEPVSDE